MQKQWGMGGAAVGTREGPRQDEKGLQWEEKSTLERDSQVAVIALRKAGWFLMGALQQCGTTQRPVSPQEEHPRPCLSLHCYSINTPHLTTVNQLDYHILKGYLLPVNHCTASSRSHLYKGLIWLSFIQNYLGGKTGLPVR